MASKISLVFLFVFAVALTSQAATIHKRDVDQSSVISDASQALDKLFEDLNKGIKQLANDGVNFDGIVGNITSKANELGNQLQTLGKELGDKVQEAAKKQGLAS